MMKADVLTYAIALIGEAMLPYFILIVDNEVNQRFMLEQALHIFDRDWLILTAANGQEALEIIAMCAPQLIITDYHMPGMDGLTLIAQVRAQGFECPIMMITAYMSPKIAEMAGPLSIAHCLTKPVPLAQVRRLVMAAFQAYEKVEAPPL